MEKMGKTKILIEMPTMLYLALKLDGVWGYPRLTEIIRNGTPLPKGHGRLKDVDAFISKVKADREHSAYSRSWTADDVLNVLDNSYASTIVGAESEE